VSPGVNDTDIQFVNGIINTAVNLVNDTAEEPYDRKISIVLSNSFRVNENPITGDRRETELWQKFLSKISGHCPLICKITTTVTNGVWRNRNPQMDLLFLGHFFESRNHNFSKVGTGTVKNSSTTLEKINVNFNSPKTGPYRYSVSVYITLSQV
jgi:hypothetical protein